MLTSRCMSWCCLVGTTFAIVLSLALAACGESDETRCGPKPRDEGSGAYPENASNAACGVSVCGAFYEFSCPDGAKEWVTTIQDCNCVGPDGGLRDAGIFTSDGGLLDAGELVLDGGLLDAN